MWTGGGGTLGYELDGYVPTRERKQGAFGVGFRRKKGLLGVESKCDLFQRELSKIRGHSVLIGSNLSKKLPIYLKIDNFLEMQAENYKYRVGCEVKVLMRT